MFFKQLFAKKSLEMLHEEMQGEDRLHRVLGPVGLTALGVGAIIGAGIFVITGRVAANDAGPAVLVSFAVAGLACAFAAFCYAEFASMAPVAGSAYTYAYATLGELFAWIIGWDLILEYAMSCATVAASWSKYLNAFLKNVFGVTVPYYLCHDPFSEPGAYFNLPAVLILLVVTVILVIGIRESAASNTVLVLIKLGVVLFVIAVGAGYVAGWRWTEVSADRRKLPEQRVIPDLAKSHARKEIGKDGWEQRAKQLAVMANAQFRINYAEQRQDPELTQWSKERYARFVPTSPGDREAVKEILTEAAKEGPEEARRSWGILGKIGLDKSLSAVDDATRSNFMPYGFSGLMVGAALVFFAFIGFDSISTHSEEAKRPQRDVPIGILASLTLCTVLYIAVAGVITGMVEYEDIDTDAAIATAFEQKAAAVAEENPEAKNTQILKASAGLIASGALAGMTSVLLITFLSQARIFLAMARDGLLPHAIFGAVHERFRTPHISTMLTGAIICVVAAFTPILVLEEMVNIGTLFAFVVVCSAVLILRIKRPEVPRPFRCPAVFLVAPLGIVINLVLMLFLAWETWLRLVVWLIVGLVFYMAFGRRYSRLAHLLRQKG